MVCWTALADDNGDNRQLGVDIGGAGAMADDGEAAELLADEIEDNATM